MKSLQGDYRREHLFTLRQSLECYKFSEQQIIQCDQQIESLVHEHTQQTQMTFEFYEPITTVKKPCKNAPHFDAQESLYRMVGVDLTEIPGINEITAQKIIFEIGLDMTKWPTVKHFTSWLGLSPNNKISAGKILSHSTRKVKNYASDALRLAAASLRKSQTYLGAFFRRIKSKSSTPEAITATARKIAVLIYTMIRKHKPYKELGADFYIQQHSQRMLKNLQRNAQKLGYTLVPQVN